MAVHGNLRDMTLTTLITVNCNEHNQGRLRLQQGPQEAFIYFDAGQIAHIVLGDQEGEEVITELLTWEDGEFELELDIPPPARTVTTPWSNLVLEGLRRLDEKVAEQEAPLIPFTEEEPKMAKLNDLLKEMAGEIPGFIATDVVGMDGISIAGYTADPAFNAEAASAQFALVMKLVQKTVDMLKAGEFEDNLVTTDKAYILTRMLGDGSYYLGVAVDRNAASLGNLRMIARQYTDALWSAIPKRR